ncbi:hypothetical protein ABPG75_010116 [Micractinium tetrahymenae]
MCDGNLAVCRLCSDVEKNPVLAVYSKKIANFNLARSACQQCDAGCGLGNGGSCLSSGTCRACDKYYGMVAGECQECDDPNDLCLRCDGNPSA